MSYAQYSITYFHKNPDNFIDALKVVCVLHNAKKEFAFCARRSQATSRRQRIFSAGENLDSYKFQTPALLPWFSTCQLCVKIIFHKRTQGSQ
jgi:hypothetical protein